MYIEAVDNTAMTQKLIAISEALALLAGCALAFLVAWTLQGSRLRDAEQTIADMKEGHAQALQIMTEKLTRQHERIGEIANDSQARIDALARVAADAGAKSDRLRDQLEAIKRRAAVRAAAPAEAAGVCPPADPAGQLLPDMLGECRSSLLAVGAFADRSRIAGLACERAYSAVTEASSPR